MTWATLADWRKRAESIRRNLLVAFRSGNFFEFLGDDARTVARVCGLTLTTATIQGESVPMAGVPVHKQGDIESTLYDAGHHVAWVDRVS